VFEVIYPYSSDPRSAKVPCAGRHSFGSSVIHIRANLRIALISPSDSFVPSNSKDPASFFGYTYPYNLLRRPQYGFTRVLMVEGSLCIMTVIPISKGYLVVTGLCHVPCTFPTSPALFRLGFDGTQYYLLWYRHLACRRRDVLLLGCRRSRPSRPLV
jgi:hypothetical protein